ncbi:MAG: type IV toxin-antitoxin system AbiEi family antitoxin domain-containing protein [Bryobacteraceae bacterium]|nr:type IV toxin-antitoxin system AbiEi family antitoxin domain-containing protein [Bryobacteraceae bacterium]
METLGTAVIHQVGKAPEGVPVAAKELLHLGTRAAVDQTLSRLVRRGSLIRVGRGLYVRPVQGRFGVRPPEPATVVQAMVEHRGESIVPHGAAAANELGLTTQVPVREVYLTSGPTRKLKLGNQVVELRHAPAWQLALPGRKAGALIRALAWLGPEQSSQAIEAARGKLTESEQNAVLGLRRMLPTWMARQVSKLATHA